MSLRDFQKLLPISGACLDTAVQNIHSKYAMTKAGWTLDVQEYGLDKYAKDCDSAPFWGFNTGNDVGSVSSTFQGSGTATLTFGGCWNPQQIQVSLNDKVIAKSTKKHQQEIKEFQYRPNDVLKISEAHGIIQIFSLQLECGGTFDIC